MDFSTYLVINQYFLGLMMALLGIYLLSKRQKYSNLPPGPRGLPFLGHLPIFFKTGQIIDMHNFSKRHGRVFSLQFGQYCAYILNSFDVIKEALVDKPEFFSERPVWLHDKKKLAGVVFNKNWSERKRFVLTSMRDFGLGKKSLDTRIQEEAGFLVENIAKGVGEAVDLTLNFHNITANIICSIIIGNRFNTEDEGLREIIQAVKSKQHKVGISFLKPFIPVFNRLPFKPKESLSVMVNKVHKWKEEHEKSFDPDNIRDLIDLFIAESRKQGSTFEGKDLLQITLELFYAGTMTTGNMLSRALLYFINYPHIQEKCYQEIKQNLGSRVPVYADIKKVPYINGFMNECLRHSQHLGEVLNAMAAWHSTKCDTELGGYTIPANSIIICNMSAALRDPKYWEDPDRFDPARWLDGQGNMIKNPAFIPFSFGKRPCLGEQLAKREIFIVLVVMLQNFRFEMADESNPPSVYIATGEGFNLRAHKR